MREKYKTLKFFLKLVKDLQPRLFILRGIYSLFKTLEILLIMYIPSIIIMMLSKNLSYKMVSIYVIAGMTILLMLRTANKLLNRNAVLMETKFFQSLIRDISNKIVSVPFSQVEDSEFVAKKEEALFPIRTQGTINLLFNIIPTLVQASIILLSVLSILLVYEPILMIYSVILAGLGFGLCRKLVNIEAQTALDTARQNKEYVYYLRTIRSPEISKDVRIYKMQPFILNKINSLFDFYIKNGKKLYNSREYRGLINQIISVILIGLIYVHLIIRASASLISGSTFILLVNASINFNSQINVFLSELLMLNQQLIYLKPLKEFYELTEARKPTGNIILKDKIRSIEFKDVYFRYPKTDRDVLAGCSFKIEENQNLSIVGRNGSGKTTIIKLLARLYSPQSGEIFVNGVNIKEYEEKSYLKQLSIIFQDFKIFAFSLKENIILNSDFDDDKFNQSIDKSELTKELDVLPNGVDTKLSKGYEEEGVVSLSKGQEQKLVIARSIYQDGSLLILDEPTASLEPIAEEEVYKHFQSVTQGKLAIFISHRLSSCRFSDKIIYLSDGRVSEWGNHNELMTLNKEYAALFNLQASKYK